MTTTLPNTKFDLSDVRLLLAEDNLHMRKMLRALLTGMGVKRVDEAEDGAQALEHFANFGADIILTDWEMPLVDGLELTKFARDQDASIDPYVPIIMMSGYSSRSRVLEARDCGVTEFICKPVAANTLYLRLISCFVNPRPFVRAPHFFGPDRRRFINPTFRGKERRVNKDEIFELDAI